MKLGNYLTARNNNKLSGFKLLILQSGFVCSSTTILTLCPIYLEQNILHKFSQISWIYGGHCMRKRNKFMFKVKWKLKHVFMLWKMYMYFLYYILIVEFQRYFFFQKYKWYFSIPFESKLQDVLQYHIK